MVAHDWRQNMRTVWWDEDALGPGHAAVGLLDQSLLPQEVVYLRLEDEQQIADAISSLKVRGAPAIGVTAAFGMALALHRFYREQGPSLSLADAQAHLQTTAQLLRGTRPTAVNLFWAIERMQSCAERAMAQHCALPQLVEELRSEALSIADEDEAACFQMGTNGAALIEEGAVVLTHCNAGALATAGMGTALAPIYIAHRTGKQVHAFVDETRPVLQGARLTAWELQQAGVPFTLITDNMAGHFMRKGIIKAIFVGADRIAANGDVANKIGTYSLAVLAHAHALPFYVVAPCSTIDLALSSGDFIPIEERRAEEVTTIGGVRIAPSHVSVANPAFDVTPHGYVTAIITERGVARPPFAEQLRQLCEQDEALGKVRD